MEILCIAIQRNAAGVNTVSYFKPPSLFYIVLHICTHGANDRALFPSKRSLIVSNTIR